MQIRKKRTETYGAHEINSGSTSHSTAYGRKGNGSTDESGSIETRASRDRKSENMTHAEHRQDTPIDDFDIGDGGYDDEYEYVELSEYISDGSGRILSFVNTHSAFFLCMTIMIVCIIIIVASRQTSTIVIILAFVMLTAIAAFALRAAWISKKDADALAKKAEMIYEAKKRIQFSSENEGERNKREDAERVER